jgi:hypothetical protein
VPPPRTVYPRCPTNRHSYPYRHVAEIIKVYVVLMGGIEMDRMSASVMVRNEEFDVERKLRALDLQSSRERQCNASKSIDEGLVVRGQDHHRHKSGRVDRMLGGRYSY